MADIQSFTITPTGRKNVPGTIPTFTISAQVYDEGGTLMADLTGAHALAVPAVMASLTDEQVARMTNRIAIWLVLLRAGLDPGI